MTAIDPTTTAAWEALEAHDLELTGSMREWFADDPQRAERFSHAAADLHVDLSKNLLTPETVQLLLKLAREVGVEERRERSEERRVGRACRAGGSTRDEKKQGRDGRRSR